MVLSDVYIKNYILTALHKLGLEEFRRLKREESRGAPVIVGAEVCTR